MDRVRLINNVSQNQLSICCLVVWKLQRACGSRDQLVITIHCAVMEYFRGNILLVVVTLT